MILRPFRTAATNAGVAPSAAAAAAAAAAWTATIAAIVLATTVSIAAAPAPDYLSIGLRAEVERLKRDVLDTPTNVTNRSNRARILWDWSNAYAVHGGYLPVELSSTVAIVLSYPAAPAGREPYLDALIRELTLLDEEPDALGRLQADPGPFEANAFVTITQTYTVGERDISTGGGVLLGSHFMARYGQWQSVDPAADNYVSVTSSNDGVNFVAGQQTMPCMAPCVHSGFRTSLPSTFFRVASGRLTRGDTVTITYGDRSEGSRGFQATRFSTDRMPLPLYVALDHRQHFLSLPIQPIRVTGTDVAGVHVFAPSSAAAGESLTLSVRAEDRFYNRARGELPGWRVLLNGDPFREIQPGREPITLIEDVRLDAPGVYRFSAESLDGSITGTGNPILVEADPAYRIYWGDTHGHSGFAEGIGTPDRFMRWARDDARLDFVSHSEHDLWLDDAEWEVLKNNVAAFTEDGRFVAYLGYEWTVANINGGHHNVLFRTPGNRQRVPMQFYPTLSRLYSGLRTGHDTADVVVIPHAHQAGDARRSDPELEPVIEIASMHGTFDWFARSYLNHGHQIGFTAASDNHLSQPGYTSPLGGSLTQRGGLGAVLAPARTTDGLFDAMRGRRTYATSGERIILQANVNGVGMGGRAPYTETRQIAGRVIGTDAIEHVAIIRNGRTIWERDYTRADPEGRPARETAGDYAVVFRSASAPQHAGDNPRGWRRWRGRAIVEGAVLEAVNRSHFHKYDAGARIIDQKTQTIDFDLTTRGNTNRFWLRLSDVKRTARVSIQLDAVTEFGGAPPIYRPPADLPARSVMLEIAAQTPVSLDVDADYPVDDTIEIRRIPADLARDVTFQFEDRARSRGDSYYVRVRQANDSEAWSSPIWVGGHPPR